MKTLLICFLSVFCFTSSFAQLKIKKHRRLAATNEAVIEFIEHNKFDYALFSWTTSNWLRLEHSFDCVIKQKHSWFLAEITSIDIPPRGEKPKRIFVKSVSISNQQADSIMAGLKLNVAFLSTQEAIDKLDLVPTSYMDYSDGIEHGKEIRLGGFKDYNHEYLLEFSNGVSKTAPCVRT